MAMECRGTVWLAAFVFIADGVFAERLNPYSAVVERNIFGLKAVPEFNEKAAPAAPVSSSSAQVVLRGITSIFGPSSTRALLEIIEQEPGKQGSTRRPILREGERDGDVELVSIDLEKNIVKIRNAGAETELTFPKPVSSSIIASATPPGGVVHDLAGASVPGASGESTPALGPLTPGMGTRGYPTSQGITDRRDPLAPVSTFGRRPRRP